MSEQYQIGSWLRRKTRARSWIRGCANSAAQVPGDTRRNLQVSADYSSQTFKQVLLPVWLLNYQYGATAYRIVANGATGALARKYPKSWIKIPFLVLFLLIVGLMIFYFAEG